MKRHLRILSLLVAVVMMAMSFAACSDEAVSDPASEPDSGVSKAVELYGTDYQYTTDELEEMKKVMFSFMPAAPSLHEAFSDYFYVGGCINSGDITGKGENFTSMMKQFNTFVLENECKPENLHPDENRYYWDTIDRFMDFGEEYGVRLRGHTLLWHAQVPNWFFFKSGTSGEAASAKQVLDRIDEHVTTIIEHCKGKIDVWDVVNEVFNDDGTLRDSRWLQLVGDYDGDGDKYDYIEQAFISARAADPDARLIINDYNMEWSEQKTISMYLAVKKMLEDGVPIDGVGLQMHIGYDTNIDTLRSNLEKLAKLREINPDFILEVTELDMNCNGWDGDPNDKEFIEQFNKTYADLFALLMEYSEMGLLDTVVFWGINDGHSWLNSSERDNYPFLIDRENKFKSAYWDVISLPLSE